MPSNLAIDRVQWELDECYKVQESFEYFLDEYVYIEDKLTQQPIKLKLWPSQADKIQELQDNRLVTVLKAHQLGYTWIFVAAYCLWRAITQAMHHIVINSFNEDVGIEILVRMDFILDRLPSFLVPPVGKSNTQLKEFIHIDERGVKTSSVIQVIPATEKGGQSKTPTIFIIDESAQNRYVRKAYVASKPGIDSAQGQIIIISNSIKDAPGWGFTRDIYVGSMRGENSFHRIFLPWQANPNRPKNFRAIQLQEGMTEEDFSQRYPETEQEAISALTGSYFGKTLARHNQTAPGLIGKLQKNRDEEIEFAQAQKGIMEVWRFPYHLVSGWDEVPWTKRYCIGSDVSEGLGQTYSVAYVYDRLLQELVARIRSNRTDAHTWANLLWQLSQYYCFGRPAGEWYEQENALLCVETTGAGQTTVKRLEDLGANLYMQQTAPKAGSELTKRFGWHESNQAKHDLSEDLRNWFRHTKGRVYDQTLLDECGTWILHEGGRIGPEDETKLGDCVIGAGLAIQADYFMEGKPKQIDPPLAGWQARLKEGKQSAWTG